MPQLPDYQTNSPLKFHPQFSYYIDSSFKKPKLISPECGEGKQYDMAFIALKGSTLPKDYMATKIPYVQK